MTRNDYASFILGANDCLLDAYENTPFRSIGGPDNRLHMSVPSYVKAELAADYLAGYVSQAYEFYGDRWETV